MTTHETATRYPLTWPTSWKRTPAVQRTRARFSRGVTNYHTRCDGSTYATRSSAALTVAQARSTDCRPNSTDSAHATRF